jgi:hypothetical protein
MTVNLLKSGKYDTKFLVSANGGVAWELIYQLPDSWWSVVAATLQNQTSFQGYYPDFSIERNEAA